jgi:hypothetical protein
VLFDAFHREMRVGLAVLFHFRNDVTVDTLAARATPMRRSRSTSISPLIR